MEYIDDSDLPDVTDEQLQAAVQGTRAYTLVLLRPGPAFEPPGDGRSPDVAATVFAHAKRNYALLQAGLLPIVCPVADGSDLVGMGLFDADPDVVERIVTSDPGVQAGLFTYEIHPTRSFPGSTLPGTNGS